MLLSIAQDLCGRLKMATHNLTLLPLRSRVMTPLLECSWALCNFDRENTAKVKLCSFLGHGPKQVAPSTSYLLELSFGMVIVEEAMRHAASPTTLELPKRRVCHQPSPAVPVQIVDVGVKELFQWLQLQHTPQEKQRPHISVIPRCVSHSSRGTRRHEAEANHRAKPSPNSLPTKHEI